MNVKPRLDAFSIALTGVALVLLIVFLVGYLHPGHGRVELPAATRPDYAPVAKEMRITLFPELVRLGEPRAYRLASVAIDGIKYTPDHFAAEITRVDRPRSQSVSVEADARLRMGDVAPVLDALHAAGYRRVFLVARPR